MMLWIQWVLLILGAVYFVTQSTIFYRVRMAIARKSDLLAAFIYCGGCTGFWIGLALSHFYPGTRAVWTLESWMTWPYVLVAGVTGMTLGATWMHFVPSPSVTNELQELFPNAFEDNAGGSDGG